MRNLTMLTDLYQLTMLYGYHKNGMGGRRAVFTMFFRQAPGLNYAVMAGSEQLRNYILSLRFLEEDLAYLDSLDLVHGDFLGPGFCGGDQVVGGFHGGSLWCVEIYKR